MPQKHTFLLAKMHQCQLSYPSVSGVADNWVLVTASAASVRRALHASCGWVFRAYGVQDLPYVAAGAAALGAWAPLRYSSKGARASQHSFTCGGRVLSCHILHSSGCSQPHTLAFALHRQSHQPCFCYSV